MTHKLSPIALPPLLCTDFLSYLLQHHTLPTTLIICSTREAFLDHLQASILQAPSSPQEEEPSSAHASPPHHLLLLTIHQIATSHTIALAFTPSLPHLRAYLATYAPTSDTPPSNPNTRSQKKPLLAIWGLASLHRFTVEHSAQGLSRTLAVAVEAAQRIGQRLILAESEEAVGQGGRGAVSEPWKEQVPLLSGSVRVEGEERGGGGRAVEVGAVVGRWCRFVGTGGPERSV